MRSGRNRRLVVVSNRGPYRTAGTGSRRRWVRSAGGLVAALDPVLRFRGGVWLSSEADDLSAAVATSPPQTEYSLASIRIPRAIQGGYYRGVSNGVLWPLLHSFPPTLRVSDAPWHDYIAANRSFADGVLAYGKPADLIWVHDYQLALVPTMLRERWDTTRIGWFCHVPWPGPDLFSMLPWRRDILEGILGADVVGFHTEAYARHFLACVEHLTPYTINSERMTVAHNRRRVQVIAAPIGIAVDEAQALVLQADVERMAQELRAAVGHRKIILGVDRLDYTKGIPERLRAFAALLREDRTAAKRVVLVQVMVPSRIDVPAYQNLKQEVDRLVGEINGQHSYTGTIPIHYLFRSLEQRMLYAHYRAADVALVTPLRDGMNLVAHEYVAACVENRGALVLSEFAGAASFLKEAILVNPHDVRETTNGLRTALTMSSTESARRMQALRHCVRELDVHGWAQGFIESLGHQDDAPLPSAQSLSFEYGGSLL